jgi:hypothetical protein
MPAASGWLEKRISRWIEPMARETRSRLQREFRPYNEQLEDVLNKGLSAWAE